jgi:hypothetical protein
MTGSLGTWTPKIRLVLAGIRALLPAWPLPRSLAVLGRSPRWLLAIGLFLMFGRAEAGFNSDAKISLHLKLASKGSPSCILSPVPPCNPGEGNLVVQGSLNTDYFAYVILQDGDSTHGFNGVEFAIAYDDAPFSGVDIQSWTPCGDQSFPSDGWYGTSGSSIKVAWANCNFEPLPGDYDGKPSRVIGAFRLSAFSEDVLGIAPLPRANGDSTAAVTSCPGLTVDLDSHRALGKAGFGNTVGFDPCKGRWTEFVTFGTLPSNELSTLQIKLSPMCCYRTGSIIIQGSSALEDLGIFLPFLLAAFHFPND